ncbi:alpha/beta hydrolase [Nonomuraea sp. NPDC050691]|uniref:alpha/beta fold hydrolase n=1 Tax=Nonomuraea sp. NPDC050691 TaxID=3155661 RepID=UPI0033E3804C
MSFLRVPGATLCYEVQGSGPLLLISQSGEGDAGRSVDLVRHLTGAYTVVTYDRRGLSRSTLDDPSRGVTLQEHADDVAALLTALADGPAAMLGCSLGASIGLRLAVSDPALLSVLVAHEPVSPWLLPPADEARHREELVTIQRRFREDGWQIAVKEAVATLGIDPGSRDTEPGLTPQPMDAQRVRNIEFWLGQEFTAIIGDRLDPAAVAASPVRILPATGSATPSHVYDHRCSARLADLLGTAVAVFPGGHNGNTSHPRAYAARLRELLA